MLNYSKTFNIMYNDSYRCIVITVYINSLYCTLRLLIVYIHTNRTRIIQQLMKSYLAVAEGCFGVPSE